MNPLNEEQYDRLARRLDDPSAERTGEAQALADELAGDLAHVGPALEAEPPAELMVAVKQAVRYELAARGRARVLRLAGYAAAILAASVLIVVALNRISPPPTAPAPSPVAQPRLEQIFENEFWNEPDLNRMDEQISRLEREINAIERPNLDAPAPPDVETPGLDTPSDTPPTGALQG